MKESFKKLIKYSGVYVGLIICFVILLTIASAFPTNWIKNNTQRSSEILLEEGNKKVAFVFEKLMRMEFDNYTDALMINTAYSIDNKTPFYSAFVARKNYIPGVTQKIEEDGVGELKSSSNYLGHDEVGDLHDTLNNNVNESFEYARYWHGYLIFLRPLLILFDLQQIRILLTGIFICLAIKLLSLISKKLNIEIAIIFLLGLFGVEYFYMGLSLQGCFVFLITMISSILILEKYEKIKQISLVFFVIGMLTNFLDFLTVPLVTWGIPTTLYFLLRHKNEDTTIKEDIILFIKIGICWLLGYALTWIGKWILVDLIYQKGLIKTAIDQIFYRSAKIEDITGLDIIYYNVYYMIIPFCLWGIILLIKLIKLIVLIKKKTYKMNKIDYKKVIKYRLPYIIIGLMPFVWYLLLKNHSCWHNFFTYRNLLLTIVAIPIGVRELKIGGKE